MSEMDNMTEEKRKAILLEAGTIADEMWEAKKRGECPRTVKEGLMAWESSHRMENW